MHSHIRAAKIFRFECLFFDAFGGIMKALWNVTFKDAEVRFYRCGLMRLYMRTYELVDAHRQTRRCGRMQPNNGEAYIRTFELEFSTLIKP
jgi:hypothetical protein